ncbi:MAG: hypothetical protein ABIH00_10825 [Armatimonadota bacterium]
MNKMVQELKDFNPPNVEANSNLVKDEIAFKKMLRGYEDNLGSYKNSMVYDNDETKVDKKKVEYSKITLYREKKADGTIVVKRSIETKYNKENGGKLHKSIRVFTYTKDDGVNNLVSVGNYYYINGKQQINQVGNILYPTCIVKFDHPKNRAESGAQGRRVAPTGDGGSTDNTNRARVLGKSAQTSNSTVTGTPSGTPDVTAGDVNTNSAKASEFLKKLAADIKLKLGNEYKAGERVTVEIPAELKNEIPENGIKLKFDFIGSGVEGTESEIIPDMPNFYLKIPENIKADNYGLAVSLAGKREFVKTIGIKAGVAEGIQGADETGKVSDSTGKKGVEIAEVKFYDGNGKEITDKDDRKFKPDTTFKVKVILKEVNNSGDDLVIYAGLDPDGSKDTNYGRGLIKNGKSESEIFDYKIPPDYSAGTTYLSVAVNPIRINGQWDMYPSDSHYYRTDDPRYIPKPISEKADSVTARYEIKVDKAAGDYEMKKLNMATMQWDKELKTYIPSPTEYEVPDMGVLRSTDSGFFTRDKDSTKGLCRVQCAPANNSNDLLNLAKDYLKDGRSGFQLDSIDAVEKFVPKQNTDKPEVTVNGTARREDYSYGITCTKNGVKYHVFLHTTFETNSGLARKSDFVMYIAKAPDAETVKKGTGNYDDEVASIFQSIHKKAGKKVAEVKAEEKKDDKKDDKK